MKDNRDDQYSDNLASTTPTTNMSLLLMGPSTNQEDQEAHEDTVATRNSTDEEPERIHEETANTRTAG